jgi:hypothetical protein
MSVKHSKTDVGTSAVALTAGVADQAGQSFDRSILVSNRGAASVFLGGSDVTTTDFGYELVAGGEIALELAGDELYAVAASGTQTVRVLHTRV